jgi:DNA-binding IclR family transcriptional regulator
MAGKYTSAAQQRLLKLVITLFGDVVQGYAPGDLATAVKCPAAAVTRDLDNLHTAGLVEYVEETRRWRLTPRLPQQAIKVWTAIDRAERELQHAKSRFNARPTID